MTRKRPRAPVPATQDRPDEAPREPAKAPALPPPCAVCGEAAPDPGAGITLRGEGGAVQCFRCNVTPIDHAAPGAPPRPHCGVLSHDTAGRLWHSWPGPEGNEARNYRTNDGVVAHRAGGETWLPPDWGDVNLVPLGYTKAHLDSWFATARAWLEPDNSGYTTADGCVRECGGSLGRIVLLQHARLLALHAGLKDYPRIPVGLGPAECVEALEALRERLNSRTPGSPPAPAAAKAPAPPPEKDLARTPPLNVSQLARIFEVPRKAMGRLLRAGTIRSQKLTRQSYRVVIDDLPPRDQAKYR